MKSTQSQFLCMQNLASSTAETNSLYCDVFIFTVWLFKAVCIESNINFVGEVWNIYKAVQWIFLSLCLIIYEKMSMEPIWLLVKLQTIFHGLENYNIHKK